MKSIARRFLENSDKRESCKGKVGANRKIRNKNFRNVNEARGVETSTDFEKFYEGSYYTIAGAGGDLNDWVNGYNDLLKEKGIGTPKAWFTFKGEDINSFYDFEGDKRFQSDLTFLVFPLDGLETGKLAMFKLQMEDRWFDDLVDNSK